MSNIFPYQSFKSDQIPGCVFQVSYMLNGRLDLNAASTLVVASTSRCRYSLSQHSAPKVPAVKRETTDLLATPSVQDEVMLGGSFVWGCPLHFIQSVSLKYLQALLGSQVKCIIRCVLTCEDQSFLVFLVAFSALVPNASENLFSTILCATALPGPCSFLLDCC